MSKRLFIVCTFILTSCSGNLGPHQAEVDLNTVQAQQTLGSTSIMPSAWPQENWWESLNSPTLNHLIPEALNNNPDIHTAMANARKAMANAAIANSQRFPFAQAKLNSFGVQIPSNVFPGGLAGGSYSTFNFIGLDFAYTFDLWGGKRAAWEAAVGEAQAAEIDNAATQLLVSVNVARAYAQFVYLSEQQMIAQASLKDTTDSLKLVKQRVSAGLDGQSQQKLAETQVHTAQIQLTDAIRRVDITRISLATLLGQGPDRGLSIAPDQTLTTASLALPSYLAADLVGRRPDVVAARWRVEAARKNIKVTKTQFYPNVNLTAVFGFLNEGTKSLLDWKNRFEEFAPAVSLPLYSGGNLQANLKVSYAEYDNRVAQYNKIVINAINEVSNHVVSSKSFTKQTQSAQLALQSSKTAYNLALARYRNGLGSYLDVLTAKQQLLQSEQQLVELKEQQTDVAIQLIQSLGGGFGECLS